MLTALIVIIGLAILILGHEAGHFFVAKLFGMKIDEFGFGFPPRIFARRKGETEYSFNWLPFGGFVKISGENDRMFGDMARLEALPVNEKKRMFFFQAPWRRAVVIVAGVAVNFLIGWLLISGTYMVGTAPALLISGVQPGSPAERAGIMPGDTVQNYVQAEPFTQFVSGHRGEPIEIELIRGSEKLTIVATPRTTTQPNQGALGVLLTEDPGIPRLSLWGALQAGWREAVLICELVLYSFGQLVKNLVLQGSLLEGVVGPVGLFGGAAGAREIGLIYLIKLIALISLNLAVINLLPFPALDGGRFLFILIEKTKGSPVPRTIEAWVNAAGFAFLILLMVLLTARDISGWF